ncbi:MAG: polysaccharide biosynthesis C-terminal domain-containing protein [Flavobacteriales bacterium]|nr:polysaccharide biosynthesis C-terminal domain-containing protein [Flavobacteriales bacterium]
MKEKFYNLVIRGSAIIVKLAFTLFLGSVFTESEFGLYSLIISSIYISLILIGFDIYLDCNRKIIQKENQKDQAFILNNQLAAYIPFYLLFSIIIFFIPERIIPKDFIFLFFSISIIEHLNSEIFRLLLALRKTVAANLLFFIRNALWPLVILVLYYFNFKFTISILLSYWLYASILALIIGITFFKKKYKIDLSLIDKKTIIASYKYAFIFFIGTIAYKIVEFSDRYFIDYYLDKESVGVYSLYSQFGSVLNTIIFTIVISIGYPKLLKAIYTNNLKLIIKERNYMLIEIVIISVLTLCGGYLFLDTILDIIDKPLYLEYNFLFYLIIISNIIFNISYVYHFIMIGYKKDLKITILTLIGAGINIILNIILIPKIGIIGAIFSKIFAFIFILVSKYLMQNKLLQLAKN